MTADRGPQSSAQSITWSVENEIHLFDAMTGYKPVGVNKHFQMLMILERFCSRVRQDVPAAVIWDRLNQLYDMTALDELENLPFPNKQSEFGLPADEFDSLMQEKLRGGEQRDDERTRDDGRRPKTKEDRGAGATREKRKGDAGDQVRRAPKRAARDSMGKAGSPAGTSLPKRTRRI
ncbi:MRG/MORF4L-binding protein-like [Pollicipes pollicipes]|uniref:MRG/MORF4L-binding protein-like n=1 Tax=Pollicipes pollicipes TaxID=41117 RepID=UPI0018852AE1|nr:MRG/MORF4L-binding protein-like [Pollicipes pollicipes]XP_037075641.1 MRG/MORF4L-binding protein-like [Pollicipes pollicipes]XP_037075752.1 MRG/MORF4L-binding protein-like [Pollicipes pollicipes]XP_037075753.1 MRG/MORF4L-binding protein-like [Pollicipes pollicipes]XP_037076205.1 MRG/MORF4L-binding protein-like [Pollicipes pollicipes]XP_037076214.1 MRG/MORF4L-binding protein-like [Pollicipes pollicipes]